MPTVQHTGSLDQRVRHVGDEISLRDLRRRSLRAANTPTKQAWSGLVGFASEEFRSRSGIGLVDQHLRPSRKHERIGAARIVSSDR
jgi:hypothetical protein